MDPTMDNTKHILNYLMPIIERVNPEVYDFMQQWVYAPFCLICMLVLYVCVKHNGLFVFFPVWSSLCNIKNISWIDGCSLFTWVVWDKRLHFINRAEVGTIFALSWLITWFGHVLSDFRHVVRLYDFFLACHPLMPIYFAAVVCFHLLFFPSLSSSKPSSESLWFLMFSRSGSAVLLQPQWQLFLGPNQAVLSSLNK